MVSFLSFSYRVPGGGTIRQIARARHTAVGKHVLTEENRRVIGGCLLMLLGYDEFDGTAASFSESLRRAIIETGKPLNVIAVESGAPYASLHHFIKRNSGLNTVLIDRLVKYLDLRLFRMPANLLPKAGGKKVRKCN